MFILNESASMPHSEIHYSPALTPFVGKKRRNEGGFEWSNKTNAGGQAVRGPGGQRDRGTGGQGDRGTGGQGAREGLPATCLGGARN